MKNKSNSVLIADFAIQNPTVFKGFGSPPKYKDIPAEFKTINFDDPDFQVSSLTTQKTSKVHELFVSIFLVILSNNLAGMVFNNNNLYSLNFIITDFLQTNSDILKSGRIAYDIKKLDHYLKYQKDLKEIFVQKKTQPEKTKNIRKNHDVVKICYSQFGQFFLFTKIGTFFWRSFSDYFFHCLSLLFLRCPSKNTLKPSISSCGPGIAQGFCKNLALFRDRMRRLMVSTCSYWDTSKITKIAAKIVNKHFKNSPGP